MQRIMDYIRKERKNWEVIFNNLGTAYAVCTAYVSGESDPVTQHYYAELLSGCYGEVLRTLRSDINLYPVSDNLVADYFGILSRHDMTSRTSSKQALLDCCHFAFCRKNMLLFIPPYITDMVHEGAFNNMELAAVLYQFTFGYNDLLFLCLHEKRNLHSIFNVEFSFENMLMVIAMSVFLQGRRTPSGYGLSRLGGGCRLSNASGRVTFETPYYKLKYRFNEKDPKFNWWLLFLWYLSVVPVIVSPTEGSESYIAMNGYNICKQTGTLRKLFNCSAYTIGKSKCFKYNGNLFYSDSSNVYVISEKGLVSSGKKCVVGEYLGPQRDLTKSRYVFGTGNIDNIVTAHVCDTQDDISGICKRIYA